MDTKKLDNTALTIQIIGIVFGVVGLFFGHNMWIFMTVFDICLITAIILQFKSKKEKEKLIKAAREQGDSK